MREELPIHFVTEGDCRVGYSAMRDFKFKVNLVAVVRLRAADESPARQVVPKVLGAPRTAEIGLANQNNILVMGGDAPVTHVDFSIGSIKSLKPL
jgi:hypothetical protein